MPGNVLAYPDGTANGLLILVLSTFLLLVIPAMSMLCGALFGAARACLMTCAVEGITACLWVVYFPTAYTYGHTLRSTYCHYLHPTAYRRRTGRIML